MEYLSHDWPLPPLKKMRGMWYFHTPGHPLAGKAPNNGFFGWVPRLQPCCIGKGRALADQFGAGPFPGWQPG